MMIANGICIYEPQVIFWGIACGFHGYSIEFIDKYATCIYVKEIKQGLRYRRQLWRVGIRRYIPIVHSLKIINKFCSSLVGFVVPEIDDNELDNFTGKKYFHLMDYYLFVTRNQYFLEKYRINYVIGHTQMDKYCDFFKLFYNEYIGKTISLPFGYAKRFSYYNPFKERKNIAIGLGSINPINDPMLAENVKKQFVEYFKDYEYMHPLRRYIQTHESEFSDVIEARFPNPEKQKDFSYDAVSVLNEYKMFINDAGVSNFPPARTFEGIACGCVMVAEDNEIYTDLGFIPDVNYISFEKENYHQMHDKIKYYMEHTEKLNDIQEKSLELSKKYSHAKVAKLLYDAIINTQV